MKELAFNTIKISNKDIQSIHDLTFDYNTEPNTILIHKIKLDKYPFPNLMDESFFDSEEPKATIY